MPVAGYRLPVISVRIFAAEFGIQETGNRKLETGNRKLETGWTQKPLPLRPEQNIQSVKNFLLALLVLPVFLACKQREGKAEGEKSFIKLEDSTSYTTVQWIDSTHHDMGTIQQGADIEIPFRFKNTGDKPLIIESAVPGCGCTVAEKPDEPVMPGKEGVIKAKFSSGNYQGSQTKYVTVTANTKESNTGVNTSHSLSFTVNVEKQ